MFAILTALVMGLAPETPNATVRAEEVEEDPGIRVEHPMSLSVELSYNGLAGMGANAGYQLSPHVALDFGLGKAATGVKIGARARYNLFTTDLTPFFAGGLTVGTGSLGQSWHVADEAAPTRYTVQVSPYAQAVAGLSYQTDDGLAALVGVGYSQLLRSDNLRWTTPPTPKQAKDLPGKLESGLMFTASCGYAF